MTMAKGSPYTLSTVCVFYYTCENDKHMDVQPGETMAAAKRRLEAVALGGGWRPMYLGKEKVGLCCASCAEDFMAEESDDTATEAAEIIIADPV
jgi:hypothetical protein